MQSAGFAGVEPLTNVVGVPEIELLGLVVQKGGDLVAQNVDFSIFMDANDQYIFTNGEIERQRIVDTMSYFKQNGIRIKRIINSTMRLDKNHLIWITTNNKVFQGIGKPKLGFYLRY